MYKNRFLPKENFSNTLSQLVQTKEEFGNLLEECADISRRWRLANQKCHPHGEVPYALLSSSYHSIPLYRAFIPEEYRSAS